MRGEIIRVSIDCRGRHCDDCHLRDGHMCQAFVVILSRDYEDDFVRCGTCQDAEIGPQE